VCTADQGGDVEKLEDERLERFEHVLEARGVLPVLRRHRLMWSVLETGHPVNERLAPRLVLPRDGIDDHLPAGGSDHDHRAAGEERRALGYRAPHRDAIPLRRPLVRKEGLPNHGVDTVAADQHVCLDTRSRLTAGAVHEIDRHTVCILFEPREMVARVHALGAEAFDYGAVEHA
jgi:hypothetical protein